MLESSRTAHSSSDGLNGANDRVLLAPPFSAIVVLDIVAGLGLPT